MSESASMAESLPSYTSGHSTANIGIPNHLQEGEDEEVASQLNQSSNVEAMLFASLYTLGQHSKATDARWTVARMALEALQMFIVVFNTFSVWNIDTEIWVWKAVSWSMLRSLVLPMGYDSYIRLFYVISAVVLIAIATTVYVAMVYKEMTKGNVWLQRLVFVLQWVSYIIFRVFWASFLDYIVFMLNCRWDNVAKAGAAMHAVFTDHSCLAMPHLAHMVVAAVATVLFVLWTAVMSVVDCDPNPLTHKHMASAAPTVLLKTMILRIALVLVASVMSAVGNKTQAVLMCIIVVSTLCYSLISLPYYNNLVNHTWAGAWTGIMYTVAILLHLTYQLTDIQNADAVAYRSNLTWAVLYGICPLSLSGGFASYCYMKYRSRPITKFVAGNAQSKDTLVLKNVHRFKNVAEVEFLLRVVRKWDSDGVPDPAAAALGDFILKCAMARLPKQPTLMCLNSNLMTETQGDSQAARAQLQMAAKNNPAADERYLIYISQRAASERKSDSDALDLIGFVDYQRAYRGCTQAHQLALQAQRQFWQSIVRDDVFFAELQSSFDHMHKTAEKALKLYKRAMERYPANGKLLKAYGRFLEFVKDDPWSAARYYAESSKLGTEESLLSIAVSSSDGDIQTKLNAAFGTINEQSDGVVIVDASGTILMVNGAANRMFGYEKGELDGKTINMLMPQPYSARHNSYLQKHAATGKAETSGKLRHLVALHKDRSVFPVDVVNQQLSGNGADNIYMGIIRATKTDNDSAAKVWITPAGVILCVDDDFNQWFGVESKHVVGRNVGTLTADPEVLTRFLSQCTEMHPEDLLSNPPQTTAKFLHKYLATVDAEVTLEIGGSDSQRIYMLELNCIADTLAVMATDTKGRILFASAQLAAMIGYSVKALTTGVNLNTLLPPPYAQLHSSFMKDSSQKPPPNSCRAGAVVQLMHANGSKVSVTLQITQHDNGEHAQHVIKVYPASSTDLLDSQRVELQLNHRGVVVSVNEHAGKAVFGFQPQDLVGRPLASFVNLFSLWKQQFSEDESLLTMLATRAEQNLDVIYRAGVHSPYSDGEVAKGSPPTGLSESEPPARTKSTLLGALASRHKQQPAILKLKMAASAQDAILALQDPSSTLDPEQTPVLTLSLFRAEGLTSVVEVDRKLNIARAEPTLGLIFGVPHSTLLRKSFPKLVGLPSSIKVDDLLSTTGKKSMLKQGAALRVGPVGQLEARHLDGGLLKMSMQAVSKDGKSNNGLTIVLRVLDSSTGSLEPLLALQAAAEDGNADQHDELELTKDMKGNEYKGDLTSDESEDPDDEAGNGPSVMHGMRSTAKLQDDKLDNRLRVQQWVSSDSGGQQQGIGDNALAMSPGKALMSAARTGSAAAATDEGSAAAGSFVSGDQSDGSDVLDAVSEASAAADSEVVVDWRRAKRLKKLRNMMASHAANKAAHRYSRDIYYLFVFVFGAHVVLFSLLSIDIRAKHLTMVEVQGVSEVLEHSQMVATLSDTILRCHDPAFVHMNACNEQKVTHYEADLQKTYNSMKFDHQHLYLGYDGLRPFADKRLMEYWTWTPIPETTWFANRQGQASVFVPGNTTLWHMGNRYLQSAQDVLFGAQELQHFNATAPWYYVHNNGPAGLFKAYKWSLDTLTDFAMVQLESLRSVVLMFMLLEVLLFQGGTFAYGFYQLIAAHIETMKRFSVVLALPAVTIRSMATKQLTVDDDDKSDELDDAVDPANLAATTAVWANSSNAAEDTEMKAKSVRVVVTGPSDGDVSGSYIRKNSSKRLQQKLLTDGSLRGPASSITAPYGGRASGTFWSRMQQLAERVVNVTHKINGKKLRPDFMDVHKQGAWLGLWLVAVAVFYGVSLPMITECKGAVVSLSASALVRARVARVQLFASQYAFASLDDPLTDSYQRRLQHELELLEHEYSVLLYGGELATTTEGSTKQPAIPAAAFFSSEFSSMFFTGTACLRPDPDQCHAEGSEYYAITHQGLDAMMLRFIQEMIMFVNLPRQLAQPDHPCFEWMTQVGANDMYEGLQAASDLFFKYTWRQFNQVIALHVVLLVWTVITSVVFFYVFFWPYHAKRRTDSKILAGLLSQLPKEVDIEGHIKKYVFGIKQEAESHTANPTVEVKVEPITAGWHNV